MLPNPYLTFGLDCGERGIRTPDTLLGYTRSPGERLKPLGHLSFAVTPEANKSIKKTLSKFWNKIFSNLPCKNAYK